jgi:hypothetical protein
MVIKSKRHTTIISKMGEGSEMNPFCPKHDENPPLLKRQHGGRRSYWVCPKGHKFKVGDELKHQR